MADPSCDRQPIGGHAPCVVYAAAEREQEDVRRVRGDARLLAEGQRVPTVALGIPDRQGPVHRGEAVVELAQEAARYGEQRVGLERSIRVAGGLGDAP